jgi:hypothetical protein
MGTADIIRGIVIEASKEAILWAIGKVRDKAKSVGVDLDDHAIEAMLIAELAALDITIRAMSKSIDDDFAKLEESERKLRESPNVTVVDSLDEEPGSK